MQNSICFSKPLFEEQDYLWFEIDLYPSPIPIILVLDEYRFKILSKSL